MDKFQRRRNSISAIKERKRPSCGSYIAKSSMPLAERLKIEEANTKHRQHQERAEANHRRWKERVYIWSCLVLVFLIVFICASILLLNYSAEDKKWASAILTHGATALTTYFGVKAKSKGSSN